MTEAGDLGFVRKSNEVMRTRAHQQALDSSAVRQRNTSLVLKTLQVEGELSQADLARRLGLARSTVLAIVEELLEHRVLRETGRGASGGGRRPTMLSLNDGTFHLVGVDVGATHVTVVVVNLLGHVVARQFRPHPVRDDPRGTLALIEELVGKALAETRTTGRRLLGMGVGVPSPVDERTPGQCSPVVMPAWAGIDIAARLHARFGLPVHLDNDANLGALYEARWGAGVNLDSLAYVKVATGVGCGLLWDGRLYRGARGVAGELGHFSIDSSGPLCVCGLRGCLNTLVGSEPLLARARAQAGKRGARDFPTVEQLVERARAGDAVAVDTLAWAGRQLGLGLAMLLNLTNPGLVVLGGGLVAAGDALLGPLRETVAKHCFSENFSHARIVASQLGEAATARGAAALILDDALDAPASYFFSTARSRLAAG